MRLRLWIAICILPAAVWAQPPATPKHPVVDTYHGVKVTDDYRWLEDYSDPTVKAWSDAQNRYARQYLDSSSNRPALERELRRLMENPSPRYSDLVYRAGTLFALKTQPPKQQPMLVVLPSVEDPSSERVLVDPNEIDAKGGSEIDFFVPSLDGKKVAVSMSKGGSESGDVSVYDVATAKPLPDLIPRVNGGTAGGSLAWNADGSGFYYTRYPRSGERPPADLDFYQQVYFHKLGGDPTSDRYEIGKEFPRIAEIALSSSDDGRYVLARMANGDGGEFAHYLRGPSGEWKQITRLADEISQTAFGLGNVLYLLSHHGAPMGKILSVPLAQPNLAAARTVVTESKVAIQSFLPAAHYLYVLDQAGGPEQVRVRGYSGSEQPMPLKPVSAVHGIVHLRGDDVLVSTGTFLEPAAWYRFDPQSRKLAATRLRSSGAADFSDTEVLRDFATSKDGTKVPLNILRRKGTKLDGNNPVLLSAYGGYGISLTPNYDVTRRLLLDRGAVVVIANLRGGGEYGEEWHRGGMLAKKQNVFDDFAAAAQWLIDQHYTSPSRLAIEGGSNGGLLMGAALTQHPERYAAVVAWVGIHDMLRVELQPNGAFNVTEFGTVKEPDLFRALYAYSPYHNVKDGAPYPAVLMLTGSNDPRVDPLNSRKMVARLQAAGTQRPVLLRTTDAAGHGIGTALGERISQETDVLVFLLKQWNLQ